MRWLSCSRPTVSGSKRRDSVIVSWEYLRTDALVTVGRTSHGGDRCATSYTPTRRHTESELRSALLGLNCHSVDGDWRIIVGGQ
jgi:hypothetical protein